MGYQLLTGATGLLGSYLLRDALLTGRPMAVLARSGGGEAAEQRIETILARWERRLPFKLARPVVLTGDLTEPDLGLVRSQKNWAARHCTSVLHSGASLRFAGSDQAGEPWRTNVEGTRHVLELCRAMGVRQFHHVSTAYTCGLREGRILESELDADQQVGNDYEGSKIEAERLVHNAGFLESPTIYRPSIIVGDARTGYTTTFHGFYTPLKAVLSAVHLIDPDWISGKPLMAALGLAGTERKNVVPVDWVSAVITRIVDRSEFHGRTYHVTSPNPVPVSLVTETMEKAVHAQLSGNGKALAAASQRADTEDGDIVQLFLRQMQVYRAYWRNDPEFDQQNLLSAVPDLPCPELTREVLARLIDFALRTNFGWPRSGPIVADFDVADHLRGFLPLKWEAGSAGQAESHFGLQVNGPGGGCWELLLRNGELVAAEWGLSGRAQACFYLNTHTFREVVGGRLTAGEAAASGKLLMEGSGLSDLQLAELLQAAAGGRPQLDRAWTAGAD